MTSDEVAGFLEQVRSAKTKLVTLGQAAEALGAPGAVPYLVIQGGKTVSIELTADQTTKILAAMTKAVKASKSALDNAAASWAKPA